MTSNEKTSAYFVRGFYSVGPDRYSLTHFHFCDEETEQNYPEATRAWHQAIPRRNYTNAHIVEVSFVQL